MKESCNDPDDIEMLRMKCNTIIVHEYEKKINANIDNYHFFSSCRPKTGLTNFFVNDMMNLFENNENIGDFLNIQRSFGRKIWKRHV